MNLLLDTCALIWLTSEPAQLSKAASTAINDPAVVLHVSHASLWEITLKHGAGKLALPDSPRKWWTDQVARWGMTELPLTAEALFRASELPPHHKDPFDRVILGQTEMLALHMVLPDSESFPRMASRCFGEPPQANSLMPPVLLRNYGWLCRRNDDTPCRVENSAFCPGRLHPGTGFNSLRSIPIIQPPRYARPWPGLGSLASFRDD